MSTKLDIEGRNRKHRQEQTIRLNFDWDFAGIYWYGGRPGSSSVKSLLLYTLPGVKKHFYPIVRREIQMLKRLFGGKEAVQADAYVGSALLSLYQKLPEGRKEAFKKEISRAPSGSEMVFYLGNVSDPEQIKKLAQQWLKELGSSKQSVIGIERLQNGKAVVYIKGGFDEKVVQQLRTLTHQYKDTVNESLPSSLAPMEISIYSASSDQIRVSKLA
jgi:hypothetical protein